MSKALEGVRVLDFGHVQAGPTATQLLAWMGADVIKIEMPGRGDITRGQLQDVKGADSLYFTMLNSNKRSITVNMKTARGKKVIEDLVKKCDVVVENFGPGVLDRAGFTWERFQELNPRISYASIKGFGPGRYADFKAYENVAQCMGGSASTTGWDDGPPTVTGAQIGDSGTGVHCVAGILAALFQREKTGKGQRVEVAMQDSVLNLCRVKLRDQQRLAHGPLKEYPQYPNKAFPDATPRSGNASGGGQPGEALMKLCGREELIADPKFATPEARLPHLDECFAIIEEWTKKHTKFEVMAKLNEFDIPCGPVLDMRELAADASLRARDTVVEVDHPKRGRFLTVGCPIKLSGSQVEVKSSPLLGEHTDEILREVVGFDDSKIAEARAQGAI